MTLREDETTPESSAVRLPDVNHVEKTSCITKDDISVHIVLLFVWYIQILEILNSTSSAFLSSHVCLFWLVLCVTFVRSCSCGRAHAHVTLEVASVPYTKHTSYLHDSHASYAGIIMLHYSAQKGTQKQTCVLKRL